MAHYAKLDENNIVLEVIVVDNCDCQDDNGNDVEEKGRQFCEMITGHAKWKKTSRNTRGGIHYQPDSDIPSEDQSKAFRKNPAAIGSYYDEELDAFIYPKPEMYSSWILNTETATWEPPVPRPDDMDCYWNDSEQTWSFLVEQNFMDLQDGTLAIGLNGNTYLWNRVEKTWTEQT
jgi:hypothetical protein